MLTYNLYLLINFILGYFIRFDKTKYLIVFSFLISTIFIGLREGIGADWTNYYNLYLNSKLLSLSENINRTDAIYGVITYISHHFNLSIYFVNFVSAFIFCYGVFFSFINILKKYELYFITITPYLLVVAGPNFTRQSMAVGFFLIAIKFLLENKNKLGLLASLAALLSHSSAIFAVLVSFYIYMYRNKISPRILISIIIIFVIASVPLAPRIIGKFYFYTEEVSRSSSGVYLRLILYSVPYLLFLCKRHSLKESYYYSFIKASFMLYILCFCLTFMDSIIGDRVSVYTIPAQAVIFASLWLCVKSMYEKIIIYIICLFYSFAQLNIWLVFSVWAEKAWIPYDNFLLGLF